MNSAKSQRNLGNVQLPTPHVPQTRRGAGFTAGAPAHISRERSKRTKTRRTTILSVHIRSNELWEFGETREGDDLCYLLPLFASSFNGLVHENNPGLSIVGLLETF
jgi:hypothetical protein